jgi:hypothetical protein
MQEIKKKKKLENPNEIYNYIQSLIEIYIEENQDFPNKTINKLIKILNYINLIFENEETEDENIKIIENLQSTISSLKIELETYKNKIEILLKENERMIKEEKELHPYQLLLNQKLKSKDDKYRLMEQKYLYYINDQKKEILDLKKELYDEQLKNYENQDSNKINLFPGIIRKPERKKSKSIKLIPMFKTSNLKKKFKFKIKINSQKEENEDKINLTTKTENILNRLSIFDENKLLGNKIMKSVNTKNKNHLVFHNKMKEFNDIMMSYPEFFRKHNKIDSNHIHNNTII